MNLLFICTANICRSQMAAKIMEQILQREEKTGIFCRSAGFAAVEGQPVAREAVQVCREIGIDLEGCTAHRMTPEDLAESDLVIVMTDTHAYIMQQAGVPADHIYKMDGGILDPQGGGLQDYRYCRDEICRAAELLACQLLTRQGGME